MTQTIGLATKQAQIGAAQAITQQDWRMFLHFLDEGARVELTINCEKPSYEKNMISLSLIEEALCQGMYHSYTSILELLESKGFDVASRIERVVNPLEMLMSMNKNSQGLDFLLDRWPKAWGDWRDTFEIHHIVRQDHSPKIASLLKRGVDVDERDDKGKTALMHATHTFSIATLLDAGADKTAVDHEGKTALWHAIDYFISKTKLNRNGSYSVSGQHLAPLIALSQNNGFSQDPSVIFLIPRIKRRLDKGLLVDGIDAFRVFDLKNIMPQIDYVNSLFKIKALKKYVTNQSHPPPSAQPKM